MSDHVPERTQFVFLQHPFHCGKHARNFAASSQYFFVGQLFRIFRFGHARDGQLPTFQPLHVFLVSLRSDQLVVTVPDELKQVFQELPDAGGANEVAQVQFAEPAAQVNPEILIVENAKFPAILAQQFVAVLMKGRDSHAGQIRPTQLFLHPLPHLLRRIFRIGNGKDFVGPGMALTNQVSNALGKNSGLSSTRAGNDQHGPMDVFDGFVADVRPVRTHADLRLGFATATLRSISEKHEEFSEENLIAVR